MKKIMVLIISISCVITAQSQIAGIKSKNAIKVFDSIDVNIGDTIYLGSGSDRKGDFVSIYQPPNYWIGVRETSLPRDYSGKYVIIKFFKNQSNKRTGDKRVAIINPSGGLNFIVDIEGGVRNQEILGLNQRSFVKKAEPTVIIQQPPQSLADEVAKLKKLYDDGVLSKEEYDAAKKKLIEKQ
jgi:hypothetical protein